MAYENHDSANSWNCLQQLPELSSFLKHVRFSQIVQAKIADLNQRLKSLENEKAVTEETYVQLNNLEKQMTELIKIKDRHLSENT